MTKTPIHPRSPLGVFELHHKPTGNDNLQQSIKSIETEFYAHRRKRGAR